MIDRERHFRQVRFLFSVFVYICICAMLPSFSTAAIREPEPIPMACRTVFDLETEAIYDDASILLMSQQQLPRDQVMRNRALLKDVLEIAAEDVFSTSSLCFRARSFWYRRIRLSTDARITWETTAADSPTAAAASTVKTTMYINDVNPS